jgi:uncharacterized protein
MRLVVRDGTIVVEAGRRLPGRGAYVCPEPACVSRSLRPGGLTRRLRVGAEAAQGLEQRIRVEQTPRGLEELRD